MTTPDDFAAFARDEHPRLVRALTLYCGDAGVAEELAQDTLVRCRDRWTRVRGARRPGAYAHRIAINLANSRFRRAVAERRAMARVRAGADTAHHDPCGADGEAVRVAVSGLPPRQREVIVRRYLLDESVAEVAAAMGTTTGTVTSQTSAALDALRDHFGAEIALDTGGGR